MTRNRTKVWDLNYVTVIMSATTPRHANGRPPSEGGMYLPKAPPVEPIGGGRVRQKRRPAGEVNGFPGNRVG